MRPMLKLMLELMFGLMLGVLGPLAACAPDNRVRKSPSLGAHYTQPPQPLLDRNSHL